MDDNKKSAELTWANTWPTQFRGPREKERKEKSDTLKHHTPQYI